MCTPRFMDDVIFSPTIWPESSTTPCVEDVRQVVVPVRRQTTSAWPDLAGGGPGAQLTWGH